MRMTMRAVSDAFNATVEAINIVKNGIFDKVITVETEVVKSRIGIMIENAMILINNQEYRKSLINIPTDVKNRAIGIIK